MIDHYRCKSFPVAVATQSHYEAKGYPVELVPWGRGLHGASPSLINRCGAWRCGRAPLV